MDDLIKQLSELSAEERKLLELVLKEKGVDISQIIIPQKRDRREFPLSYAQHRLWFLNQLEPESFSYNIPSVFRITGSLNLAALEQSINEIVHRHESLRTVFRAKNGEPYQIILEALPIEIPLIHLDGLEKPHQEREVERLAREEARKIFDLSTGPLFRVTLLKLAEDEYILLLTMHHIIADGYSTAILIQEFSTLYEAFSQGKPSPLPELTIQYVDFAVWQREWLQGEVLEEQIDYWKKQLEGAPPYLELPTDFPRPPIKEQASRGAQQSFELPASLYQKLSQLAQQEGATLFMVLLAAFQILLYRYTGQDDINVGTPIANRNRAEIENLIGFFINTLVMRGDLSSNPSFREFLKRVRETAIEAYSHQDLPFEMLVDELKLERDMSHSPLFQVMFVLQNAPGRELKVPGLAISPLEIDSGIAKFDLTLEMVEADGKLQGLFKYNADLFEASTIQRMIGHFRNLLESIVVDPDRSISTLSLLTKEEEKRILVEWNQEKIEYPHNLCMHQLFEKQVEIVPDALAVVYPETGTDEPGDRQLTFRELNFRANQLARYLRIKGVGPETKVGLVLERSVDMMVGVLGILKAGGAFVPIDPNYPAERIAFIFEDTRMPVVITMHELLKNLPSGSAEFVCLDKDWPTISQLESDNLSVAVTPENLAYIIYTSGSTGNPKGVMVQHQSVMNLAANLNHYIYKELDSEHVNISLNAPLIFDASMKCVIMMFFGHTLYIVPEDIRGDGRALVDFYARNRIVVGDCVPSQLKLMVEAGLFGPENNWPKILTTGGEALDDAIWQSIQDQNRIVFFNMYGPTECTVEASITKIRPEYARPTIGRAIANTRFYVLDKDLQPVPVGVPGELNISGANLARGYLNRADLTAQVFVPDPFSGESGARMYRTGDLVRWRPDGMLEFLGRIDHQVKLRGYRIELGEIENSLRLHPQIKDALVILYEKDDNKYLAAYCIPADDRPVDRQDVRNFLRQHLPEYMVPTAYVFLEQFPLTPSGKINRRMLPPPQESDLSSAEKVKPRNATEELLATIWQDVLKINEVGAFDNFFELGGHSLIATQLMSRIRDAFQIELPLRTLFESPTVAGLAERIHLARQEEREILLPPLKPAPRDGELPLSFAQQRLWFLDQLEPGGNFYNIPMAIQLKGHLNIAALEASFNEIVRRHEVLRTTFQSVDGKPLQVISPPAPIDLLIVDLTNFSREKREKEVKLLIIEEAQRPFDLARGPLLRTILIRTGEEEHIALINMHHIISDGWSMGVFFNEIATLYQAYVEGRPSPLEELPIQYADYAYWERQWLQGEVLEKQLAYWKKQLADSPPVLELPTDRPRPSVQTFWGANLSFEIPENKAAHLKKFSQQQGVTLFMILLAVFQTLLYRYSRQEDILVGFPISGRNHSDLEKLIGFFVNTLVLRTDFSNNPTFSDLLRQVREVTLEAFAHQDVPFEKLVDELQPVRDLSHAPLFQVAFVYQNMPMHPLELPELTFTPLEFDSGIAKYDLAMIMVEEGTRLRGSIEFNTDLFNASTIRRMIQHFQNLLEAILTDPDQPVGSLDFLSAEEKQRMLVEWNQTDVPFPAEKVVHQLFEEVVDQNPDQIALVFEDQLLTYGEVNRRANQMAHFLRENGVGPEQIVGICLERSPELIISLLAVLKAGGAYVPMDPIYPADRLEYMVHDSGMSMLITQQSLAEKFPRFEGKLLLIDREQERLERYPSGNLPLNVVPENLAYIIYTSGSTGQPKGTLLQHKGLVNVARVMIKDYEEGPGKHILQFASISFDASASEIYPALLSGATLHLATRDALLSVSELTEILQSQKITNIVFPPTMLSVLPGESFPDLQTVVSAGEACTWEIARTWAPNRKFLNGYGPTETTIATTWFVVDRLDIGTNTVPIGSPIQNYRVYLLDDYLNPVPIGVPGELYVGSVGLARGYLGRPDLTAERFVPNPFDDTPGSRLYRTGDLVRYLPDGNMEFVGRVDFQVKIRGFRIELGEIEAILRQHPEVQDVVVIAREDNPGEKKLVAYVVAKENREIAIAELRNFLKERLPDYMVPAAFVQLETLPLTNSGKVNRRALPKPEYDRSELMAEYVPPKTPEEKILAEIWSQVLGVKQVGIHDNFFELGGDSILSIQIIARANQAGLQLTPKQIFEHQTIAELATVAGKGPAIEAEQGIVTGELPLTPIQHWFFEQELPDPHHFNQSILLTVKEPMEAGILREVVRHLLIHHDALRLRFERTGPGWRQFNAGVDEAIPFHYLDLSKITPDMRSIALEIAAEEFQASLNLAEGPLFRIVYFHLGADEPGRLLIVIHHLAVDGVSWRILLEDLQTAYRQLREGREVQLPPKTTAFRDWARKLAEYARSPEVKQEFDHWSEINKRHIEPLPLDYPEGENVQASRQTVVTALNKDRTSALLHEVPSAYHTQINEVLLAALARAFARWTGKHALLVALEGHGREDMFSNMDISRTVGWFTSLYPVLLDINECISEKEVLIRVKEQLRRIPNRGINYGLLRYLTDDEQIRQALQTAPEPQVSFNYLGQFDQLLPENAPFGSAPESKGKEQSPRGKRKYLVDVVANVSEGELQIRWIYSGNLFKAETIEALAQAFLEELNRLIDHCLSPEAGGYSPSDFPDVNLSDEEIDNLLSEIEEEFEDDD